MRFNSGLFRFFHLGVDPQSQADTWGAALRAFGSYPDPSKQKYSLITFSAGRCRVALWSTGTLKSISFMCHWLVVSLLCRIWVVTPDKISLTQHTVFEFDESNNRCMSDKCVHADLTELGEFTQSCFKGNIKTSDTAVLTPVNRPATLLKSLQNHHFDVYSVSFFSPSFQTSQQKKKKNPKES